MAAAAQRSSRIGRAPSLTRRGQAWAALGALLLVVGALAGAWRLAALGVISLASLGAAYLSFFPSSVIIWRRHVELQWGFERPSGEGGFVVGRAFRLVVTLRNLSPRGLGRASLRVYASAALEVPSELALELAARREVTVAGSVTPLRVGYWQLHGAAVELCDRFGLASVEAYFPSALQVKIFPRPSVRAAPPPRPVVSGAPHERLGLHALRLRGLGGDLRELRDHAPGDPFKLIAWKASARTGRLMVRDLDREIMVTHLICVDVGAGMRHGVEGGSALDLAVELAIGYARAALEAGDRVGLFTYDRRIVAEVKPNDGPGHRLRLLEPLMEAMNGVDEDLTELTDSEVVELAARYLLFQEGVDARVPRPPPIDDPVWAFLSSSPSGELYDLRLLQRAAEASLGKDRSSAVLASSTELSLLRRFCRRRGLELPAKRAPDPERRARGLADVLERAAAGRGTQRIVVLSDLDGLGGNLDEVRRSLRLVRRRGHQLVCAHLGAVAVEDDDLAVAEIATWEAERRARAARRRMAALGVRVAAVGVGDSAATLVQQAGGKHHKFPLTARSGYPIRTSTEGESRSWPR